MKDMALPEKLSPVKDVSTGRVGFYAFHSGMQS
jgi:hypothetical protein